MFSQLIEFVSNHYLLSTAFVVLLCLFILNETRRSGRSLTARELTVMVNQDTAVLVDIRPKKDFTAGHIAGAVSIPNDKLASRISELDKFKDKTVIVVDENGMHAGTACTALGKAGFQVAKLSGGVASWRADSLPLVK